MGTCNWFHGVKYLLLNAKFQMLMSQSDTHRCLYFYLEIRSSTRVPLPYSGHRVVSVFPRMTHTKLLRVMFNRPHKSLVQSNHSFTPWATLVMQKYLSCSLSCFVDLFSIFLSVVYIPKTEIDYETISF